VVSERPEVRELHFQRGPLTFSAGRPTSPKRAGRIRCWMLMRVNIRCHICLCFSQSVGYLCFINDHIRSTHMYSVTEDLHFSVAVSVWTLAPCTHANCHKDKYVLWPHTSVPVAFRLCTVPLHFYEHGRTGMLAANNQRCWDELPCAPSHINHWIYRQHRWCQMQSGQG